MGKICARHELRMLGLTAATLRGATGRGLHSPEHAALLADIDACTRCRRHRASTAPEAPAAPAHVIVTFTCPEEVDPDELAATVEEALPEYAEEVTIRVA